jgi:hypothetical protein
VLLLQNTSSKLFGTHSLRIRDKPTQTYLANNFGADKSQLLKHNSLHTQQLLATLNALMQLVALFLCNATTYFA